MGSHGEKYDWSIAERMNAEHSAREIAEVLGCTQRAVARWRTRAGKRKGYPKPAASPETRERARYMLFEDAVPPGEVAATLSVSTKRLDAWFPDRPLLSSTEAGQHAALMRRANKILEG